MSLRTLYDVQRIKDRAEDRTIDMGPFGGVETFLSHDDVVLNRRTVIELCDLAAEALRARKKGAP